MEPSASESGNSIYDVPRVYIVPSESQKEDVSTFDGDNKVIYETLKVTVESQKEDVNTFDGDNEVICETSKVTVVPSGSKKEDSEDLF